MTQLATTDRKDVRSTLEGMRDQFAMALPKILKPERFIRVALTCINKNPKLLQCTRDSLLACLLDCAQLGIEPDGRRAHLIPYGDKCTLIVDYKGLAELVRRSGEISTLHAGIVYPSDEFDYMFGTGQFLKHKPSFKREEGEKPFCVYSYVRLKDGQEDFDVMSIEDVAKIRTRSRAGNNGPWVTDFDEMAKKTVFRRHSKWLPLSPELREKIEMDDEPLTEQERFASARPVGASEGIQFGESGVPAQEPNEDKPRRGRKRGDAKSTTESHETQQATKSAGQSSAAPTSDPKGAAAPPLATKLEGLRNLINASPVNETDFVKHLIASMEMEPSESLDKLSDEKLTYLIENFMDFANAIVDGRKE